MSSDDADPGQDGPLVPKRSTGVTRSRKSWRHKLTDTADAAVPADPKPVNPTPINPTPADAAQVDPIPEVASDPPPDVAEDPDAYDEERLSADEAAGLGPNYFPAFRPWPAFCAIAAVVILPFMLTRDLGSDLLDNLSLHIDTIEPMVGQWGVEFAGRLVGNMLRMAFMLGIVTALLYGLIQILALWADRVWLFTDPDVRRAVWVRVCHGVSGRRRGASRTLYFSECANWGADALLAPLRLGVTLFPMLGFLGTIVGLSGAIADLPEAVRDKDRLDPVLQDLYVAFDTTFMGLLGAILCLILVRLAEGRIDVLRRLVVT